MGGDLPGNAFEELSGLMAQLRCPVPPDELAAFAEGRGFGEAQVGALVETFGMLAERKRQSAVETLLRLSRLPQKEPKTFDNFDFGRIQGRDAAALAALPSLAAFYAGKNMALIGPGGIGKTHIAQAYARECCLSGYKSYYLKANELRDRLSKAAKDGTTQKAVASLVKPSCLVIDEIGRCVFDRAATDMLFDVIDRRYEKEGPNTLIVTSNAPVVGWDEFFTGDDALACMLDRVFDRAAVFMMKGASYRGASCETFSVESAPQARKGVGRM